MRNLAPFSRFAALVVTASVCLASIPSGQARGAVVSYLCTGTTSWSTTACWSGGALPLGGDDARFQTDGTVAVDVDVVGLNLLRTNALGTGRTITLGAGRSLSTQNEFIGQTGIGTVENGGGTHTVGNSLSLGQSGTGNYSLSGSGVLSTSSTNVGVQGSGTFTQSGGQHVATASVQVAASSGTGDYLLSGGTLTAAALTVAGGGQGNFTHSGGAATISSLRVGDLLGSVGDYALSGTASLTTNGGATIGNSGTGLLAQTGGTHLLSSQLPGGRALTLGQGGAFSSGVYDISGSAVLDITGQAYVGDGGAGLFQQSGGDVDVHGRLQVGSTHASGGTYVISGGTLDAENLEIGEGSRQGVFTQDGGTVTVGQDLQLGFLLGGNASYVQNGGTLDTTNLQVAAAGQASFQQTGGSMAATNVQVAAGIGGLGQYNMSGTASAQATSLTIGSNSGQGTMLLSDTADLDFTQDLTIGIGGTAIGFLGVSGQAQIDGNVMFVGSSSSPNASGTVNQSGGTVSLNQLWLTSGNVPATYDLTGGRLETGIVRDDGTFDLNGGTLATDDYQGDLVNDGGTFEAGHSSLVGAIQGSYQQTGAGAFEVDVGGTTAGTGYGFMDVGGDAMLDGLLRISVIGGFLPDAGDVFTVVTVGGLLSGAFSGVEVVGVGLTGPPVVSYDYVGGTVFVSNLMVDEPLPIVTLAVAALALLVVGRPRNLLVGREGLEGHL